MILFFSSQVDSEERKLREEKKREQMIEITEDMEKWKAKDCNGNNEETRDSEILRDNKESVKESSKGKGAFL